MRRDLTIKVDKLNDTDCNIFVGGNLDMTTCDNLENTFAELIEFGYRKFIVDLSDIEYLSSAGFGVFIEAMAIIREKNGKVKFVNPSPKARDVFELLGIMLDSCDF